MMSVSICARQTGLRPDNAYLEISNEPAWELLKRLAGIPPCWPATFSGAPAESALPGFDPKSRTGSPPGRPISPRDRIPSGVRASRGLRSERRQPPDRRTRRRRGPESFSRLLFGEMTKAGAAVGVGRYDEARLVYTAPAFRPPGRPLGEGRTVHIGIDLFLERAPRFSPRSTASCTASGTTPGTSTTGRRSSSNTGPAMGRRLFHALRPSERGLDPGGEERTRHPQRRALRRPSGRFPKTATGRPISISRSSSTCWAWRVTFQAWPGQASGRSGAAFAPTRT